MGHTQKDLHIDIQLHFPCHLPFISCYLITLFAVIILSIQYALCICVYSVCICHVPNKTVCFIKVLSANIFIMYIVYQAFRYSKAYSKTIVKHLALVCFHLTKAHLTIFNIHSHALRLVATLVVESNLM